MWLVDKDILWENIGSMNVICNKVNYVLDGFSNLKKVRSCGMWIKGRNIGWRSWWDKF